MTSLGKGVREYNSLDTWCIRLDNSVKKENLSLPNSFNSPQENPLMFFEFFHVACLIPLI